jgi:hypothetical protein
MGQVIPSDRATPPPVRFGGSVCAGFHKPLRRSFAARRAVLPGYPVDGMAGWDHAAMAMRRSLEGPQTPLIPAPPGNRHVEPGRGRHRYEYRGSRRPAAPDSNGSDRQLMAPNGRLAAA